MSEVISIAPADVMEKVSQGAYLVDIRDINSYEKHRIKHSERIDNDTLQDFLREADMDKPIIVCCYHGISSIQAAGFLAQQGFDEVYSLEGGFAAYGGQHPEHCESLWDLTSMVTSQTYLVGGAVRDSLLGVAVSERDYVVVGTTRAALIDLGYTQVGKDFPVFLHPKSKAEYALARTERKTGQGHQGFQVYANPEVTLEEDLLRRDLTINAIAQAPDGRLIDPYGGQKDLQAKLIRHVSDAFSEDPLRVLRAARFAAHLNHLGFSIAPQTQAQLVAVTQSGELSSLAKERVWQETLKALSSQSPWVYFEVLERCGALAELIPCLAQLLERRPQALSALKLLSESNSHAEVRLTSLLYQLNKPQIEELSQQIKLPNSFKTLALATSNHQRQLRAYTELEAAQKHLLLSGFGLLRHCQLLDDLLNLCQVISQSQEPLFGWQSPKQHILHDLELISHVKPASLMAQGLQGKALGEALKQAQINAL